jgi:hypothetical protein
MPGSGPGKSNTENQLVMEQAFINIGFLMKISKYLFTKIALNVLFKYVWI